MDDVFAMGPHVRAVPVAHEARSIGEMFRLRAQRSSAAPASFEKAQGAWRRLSWSELYDRARQVARGLADLGLRRGEAISILGPTSVPWGVYDLGSQLLGLVTVGIYPHQSAEQVRYLLEHSESRVVFVADEAELRTVLEAAGKVDSLSAIVPWTEELASRHAEADARVMSPALFAAAPIEEPAIAARLGEIDPQDTAVIVYTSGTTGPPKGAMISHANLLSLLRSQDRIVEYFQDDLLLSFLPMAHVAERNLAFYGRINAGVAAAYASSMGAILSEVVEVRPTIFGSVPRIFEKMYGKIRSEVAKKPALVRSLFDWAEGVGRRRVRLELSGRKVPAGLGLQCALADRLVFHKIRAAFGGRVRIFIVGAAPIAVDILEFLWAAGLPVYEVYGMTEATVITHANRPGATRLGSVGQVVPPMEHRVAEDGEVLMRGPFVFKGYFKNEAATAETIVDGWLQTGDIGAIDAEGFLRITDRKKHLIITAGGKNLAPANIERAIKSQSPLISQVHAHGDRRPYIAALIAPSPLETLEWGAEHGILAAAELDARRAELMQNPSARSPALNAAMAKVVADRRFREAFLEPVRRGNRDLARVEQVRRFVVLDRDFSQEEGEMTPTMKLKRKELEKKFGPLFDRIYDEEGFALVAEPGNG
jgi:long-chain acyl-CoA synthetase